jgi:hypothetical protein
MASELTWSPNSPFVLLKYKDDIGLERVVSVDHSQYSAAVVESLNHCYFDSGKEERKYNVAFYTPHAENQPALRIVVQDLAEGTRLVIFYHMRKEACFADLYMDDARVQHIEEKWKQMAKNLQ